MLFWAFHVIPVLHIVCLGYLPVLGLCTYSEVSFRVMSLQSINLYCNVSSFYRAITDGLQFFLELECPAGTSIFSSLTAAFSTEDNNRRAFKILQSSKKTRTNKVSSISLYCGDITVKFLPGCLGEFKAVGV